MTYIPQMKTRPITVAETQICALGGQNLERGGTG
jgi:hypothetical protein